MLTWLLCLLLIVTPVVITGKRKQRPNVIFILADDLGYGDLGFQPFSSSMTQNVEAPNLQRMASKGLTLTNFHVAAPICSPSRASIMVGLFPWRMGVDFIYAGDLKKDGSEEIDHEQLPLIPNIAMSFQGAGYYTAHIGKWHLGGQSHIDIPSRRDSNWTNCTVPGINQYGFDEYVGMSEGTGSARYATHQARATYATGANYLVRNDVPLPKSLVPQVLTDRQTDEAMRVIREQTARSMPFFLNLWYDAPHSPWEPIEPFYSKYANRFDTDILARYASMISNMDWNIGRLLDLVDSLGISNNTLLMFTSDNGPENGAGSAGLFKGTKRVVAEGGIRVPAFVVWKGRIDPGTTTDNFMIATDIFPTLLHAAKIPLPPHVRIDGVSALPMLLASSSSDSSAPRLGIVGDERLLLWHSKCAGMPKFTAAWTHGFKLVWGDNRGVPNIRLYDMVRDKYETNNLVLHISTMKENITNLGPQSYPWSKINQMRDDFTMIAHLGEHLKRVAHLFRHLGEHDWAIYHKNKPYETDSSCRVWTSNVASLSWSSHVLAPVFCGDSQFEELGRPLCACPLSSCSSKWFSSGWSEGMLHPGLRSLTPTSSSPSSVHQYLMTELSWSSFSPLISPQISNIDDSRSSVVGKAIERTASGCPLPVQKLDSVWASGELIGSTDVVLSMDSHATRCVQRLKKRADSWYLTGGNCGAEHPILTIHHKGMHSPLPLCPASLARLAASTPQYDDSALFFAINDIIFGATGGFLRGGVNFFDENSSSRSGLRWNQIAVIDPLLYLQAKNDPLLASFSELSASDRSNRLAAAFTKPLNGFISDYSNRLSGKHPDKINFLVMPFFEQGWSVAIMGDIHPPVAHAPARPYFIVYSPVRDAAVRSSSAALALGLLQAAVEHCTDRPMEPAEVLTTATLSPLSVDMAAPQVLAVVANFKYLIKEEDPIAIRYKLRSDKQLLLRGTAGTSWKDFWSPGGESKWAQAVLFRAQEEAVARETFLKPAVSGAVAGQKKRASQGLLKSIAIAAASTLP